MSPEPLVSVVVNNYNYGRFLADAIASALNQTYPRVEVIVVDDGSTDHSVEVIRGFGDRVRPLLKPNGGQASAFNAGFAQSRGEIVIFLDADDSLRPEIVERVVGAFGAQRDVAKVMYRLAVVDAWGNPTGGIKPSAHLPLRGGDLRRYALTCPFDLTWMATSGNAFAAEVLRQIFPIPEQAYGRVGADWYLSHLSALFGEVVFLADIGGAYRLHQRNNYETTRVDLAQVTRTIRYMTTTAGYIVECADRLGLPNRPSSAAALLSVSQVAQRLIVRKLAGPRRTPAQGDTLARLFGLGLRATARRSDLSARTKVLLGLWFALMVPAPRPVAHRLARLFLFPEARRPLNRHLQRRQRARRAGSRPAAGAQRALDRHRSAQESSRVVPESARLTAAAREGWT